MTQVFLTRDTWTQITDDTALGIVRIDNIGGASVRIAVSATSPVSATAGKELRGKEHRTFSGALATWGRPLNPGQDGLVDWDETGVEIPDENIEEFGADSLADGSVTAAKIADGAVTAAKIGTSAVTTAKINDAAVTLAKMANLAQATIIGRASGVGTGVPTALSAAQVAAIISGQTLSTIDINGGSIDGTPIGGTTPAAGAFTTITASSTIFGSSAIGANATAAVNADTSGTGQYLGGTTPASFKAASNVAAIFNRSDGDGNIVNFASQGTAEGGVSISGNTVSYNAFMASHLTQLQGVEGKPDILPGTLLESVDELAVWPIATFTDPDTRAEFVRKVAGAEGDEATFSLTKPSAILGKSGRPLTTTRVLRAAVRLKANIKHPKCKVSDTAGTSRRFGVFWAWDFDDETTDTLFAANVGLGFIRIQSGHEVANGDLLVSAGDGTAVKQADDIVRASTYAQVKAGVTVMEHPDGSYVVPCQFMSA